MLSLFYVLDSYLRVNIVRMTEFNILGPAEIRNSKGELEHSFLAGPKRLALLTYLLLSKPYGFHRRDSLLPLFWPEQDQKSARNSLSNMLYHIRKTIGPDAIKNRGFEEIMIDPQVFRSDAVIFEEAANRGNFQKALEVYRSDLLNGFYVSDISSEFDHWLEQQRNKFHTLATEGCLKLADSFSGKKNHPAAITWTQRAAELEPDSEEIRVKLMKHLVNNGDQKAALDAYHDFAAYLKREWEEEPGPEIKELKNLILSNGSDKGKYIRRVSGNENGKSFEKSIAVLPFEDLGSKELHFTEGIHGDILTGLSRIKDLQVISRTSVRHYNKSLKSAAAIGKELNATWLLEGEVQQASQKIKINTRLIHAPTDSQVWSEVYQYKLTAENLFLIQEKVTGDILKTLKIRLSPQEKSRGPHNPTHSLEAYRLYILGRSSIDLRTEDGIYRGLDHFQGSIELDPEYALSWAGLADALSLLKYYGLSVPKNAPTPLEAASRAVELDNNLGEAHNSLGIAYSGEQNGPAAIKELELAIKLAPSYAAAYIWLGWVHLMVGNSGKGLEIGKKAVRLNPLSPAFRVFLSLIYLGNGEYQDALTEAQRAQEINPDYGLTHFIKGLVLYHTGNIEQAFKSLESTLPLINPMGTPSKAEVKTVMAICNYSLGKTEEISTFKENIYGRINPFSLGILYALEGDLSNAFKTFDRVQDWGSFSCEQIRYCFPNALSGLREDERYKELIIKINEAWGM